MLTSDLKEAQRSLIIEKANAAKNLDQQKTTNENLTYKLGAYSKKIVALESK